MTGSKKGVIFDIIRGSLNDGSGIRTTVFFKGCPLRCIWCHNPESWRFEPQLFYQAEKCVHCLACVNSCPTGAQFVSGECHQVKFELCTVCGKCVTACNKDALRIIGYQAEVADIFAEIKQDKDFYDMSGGGMTLSGGEPLLQLDVALELLKKCRENQIHTCVETCGHLPRKNLETVFTEVDIFLFDYKCTDSHKHKQLTGVTNDLILENLDYLYRQGAAIILRCPMIPGINDTQDHFQGIADLAARYPLLMGIELLSYHNMGISKGSNIGVEMELQDLKTVDQEKKGEWAGLMRDLGCNNVKIG